MRLADFRYLQPSLFTFKAPSRDEVHSQSWAVDEQVDLLFEGEDFYLRQGGSICPVVPFGNYDQVQGLVSRDNALWVLRKLGGEDFDLQVVVVSLKIAIDLKIGVDQEMTDFLLSKGEISSSSLQDTLQWLREEFVLKPGGEPSRLFVAYYEPGEGIDFQILGKGWCASISHGSGQTPRLKRLNRLTNQKPEPALIEGHLEFVDASLASWAIDPVSIKLLEQTQREQGSYLSLWNLYSRKEWQFAVDAARALGYLRFKEIEVVGDEFIEWQITPSNQDSLDAFREKFGTLDFDESWDFELSEELPEWLAGPDTDLEELKHEKRQRNPRGKLRFVEGKPRFKFNEEFKQKGLKRGKGFLFPSLAGHLVVQQRRRRAKGVIDRMVRMPQLRYILEGTPLPAAHVKRNLDPITPDTRKIFKGPPTRKQKDAVGVALNTPDVALIVGPPGTGKTQVIAALNRRIAEQFGENVAHYQVLVSSYQHTAVENALSRTEVFGLPAYKVGTGHDRGEDGSIDPIDSWCKKRQEHVEEKIRARREENPGWDLLRQAKETIAFLRLSQLSPEERSEKLVRLDRVLGELAALKHRLSPGLQDDWQQFVKERSASKPGGFGSEQAPGGLLRVVRSLRTTLGSFADDGQERARQCLNMLRRFGVKATQNELDTLGAAAKNSYPDESDFMVALTATRDALIDRFTPDYRPPSVKNLLEPAACELLGRIEAELETPYRDSRKGQLAVLSEYRDALAHEPGAVRSLAREYAMIIGSTCQQADSEPMATLKSMSELDPSSDIEFDTVIIDEAARANPMDLFIPMSMARRRIVLVGDHRQLPHILDPEIESSLGETLELEEAQKQQMHDSLFKRLVDQMRLQKNEDGFDRVVMLDTQYRMHPVLGDFVSKSFYERYGEDPISSGLPATEFGHALPGLEGKVCCWIHVPHEKQEDGESFRNGSRIRDCEAKRIALETKRLMEAAPNLSFGVITFYTAQRDLILREMIETGLAEETDKGPRIRHQYQDNKGIERLRVGTVDSFQGKEFDVVLLSIVRSATKPLSGTASEMACNQRYGFLRLANRMNVAMSRQRKMLIAVGNAAMAEGEVAEVAVPGLFDFLKLCRGPHGVIVR